MLIIMQWFFHTFYAWAFHIITQAPAKFPPKTTSKAFSKRPLPKWKKKSPATPNNRPSHQSPPQMKILQTSHVFEFPSRSREFFRSSRAAGARLFYGFLLFKLPSLVRALFSTLTSLSLRLLFFYLEPWSPSFSFLFFPRSPRYSCSKSVVGFATYLH